MKKRGYLIIAFAFLLILSGCGGQTVDGKRNVEFFDRILASGECGADGDNLTWTLNSDGVLTISGIGEMGEYLGLDVEDPPWTPFRDYIKTIKFEGAVTSIGSNAFMECKELTSITIPDSVKFINVQAFSGCASLPKIEIPDSVTIISDFSFSGCSRLTSITIPDGVTRIGEVAFSHCVRLTSIQIPDSVTRIADDAFYQCDSLKDVYYKGSKEQWNNIEYYKGGIDGESSDWNSLTIHYSSTMPNA